jgi:hypothetical protein
MEKINIAELLQDCPKGMELDSPVWDNIVFEELEGDNIVIFRKCCGSKVYLTQYGGLNSIDGKCVIFPKGKTTWEGFHRPFVDGDIVAIDSAVGSQVFIFEEYIRGEKDYAHCYLMLDDNGAVDLERGEYYVERFATEEEKQKLFDAIKANGYKWNAETKTLEKLLEPLFKVGDNIRIKGTSAIYVVTEIREDCYMLDDKDTSLLFKTQDQWELVPDKFDIATLKPFESRVLVRDSIYDDWKASFWGCIRPGEGDYKYDTVRGFYKYCIPYEGNEHLLGKCDDCDEYYKTWE